MILKNKGIKKNIFVQRIPGTHLSISNYEEDINPDPRVELNGQGELAGNLNLIFSVIIFIDCPTLYTSSQITINS